MSEATAAAGRVRAFVAGRELHYRKRRQAEMFGARRNPCPDTITAEYGALDVNDLLTICDAVEDR